MGVFNLISNKPVATWFLITDGVAVSAVISPIWLPYIKDTSELAAYVMPILGVVWLGTQIIKAWTGKDKKK